jgi:hypothetical protein
LRHRMVLRIRPFRQYIHAVPALVAQIAPRVKKIPEISRIPAK